MKSLSILLLTVFLSFTAFAELSKLDAFSSMYINTLQNESIANVKKSFNTDIPLSEKNGVTYLRCLVKTTDNSAEARIYELGGKITVKAGNIWGIEIPVSNIDEMLKIEKIEKVSVAKAYRFNNNNAVASVKADLVHQGETGTNLKGEGVIVGVCDSGIDISHPDFIKDGNTRIQYLWDMSDETGINYPSGYEWGREFTDAEINAGECTEVDISGHGTHVTGTAAGNGSYNSLYTGVAPESDIVFVKATWDVEGDAYVDDIEFISAVSYIFQKAEEAGKPAVVNLSVGTLLGAHDGTGLFSQGLSELVGPGKLIVTSAGNDGGYGMHTSTEYSADEYYETMLTPINLCVMFDGLCPDIPGFAATAANFWYDAGTIDSIFVSAYEISGETGETTILNSEGFAPGDLISTQPLFSGEEILGFLDIGLNNTNDPDNNSGEGIVMIHNGASQDVKILEYIWSITIKTKEEGRFDMWSGIPTQESYGIYGDLGTQLYGDNKMTIGHPADGKKIISVGSYVTRNAWTDDQGTHHQENGVIGEISSFSSQGPTRDGRIAPIITAPGEYLISAKSADSFASTISDKYTANLGTSMASPVVTGMIALMLQVKPELDFEEVLDFMGRSSASDEYTGDLPNDQFGYGKINALEAIKELIATNVEDYAAGDMKVKIYPNPASEILQIEGLEQEVTYTIFNVAGKAINTGKTFNSINITELKSGSYFINIVDGMDAFAIPFVVSK